MEPTTAPLCGHTYTTLGLRVFRCTAEPHPNRPNEHYFERDMTASHPATRQRRRLVAVPGERDGDEG